MEFFKKRSTAWRVLLIVMVFSYFIGMSRQPADKIEILPSGVYVQDNANILSDATEEYMTHLNNGLVSKVGAEIQVVTINTVGGQDIFDVAIDHGISTNLSANSCVFLIAVEDIDAVIVQGEDLIYAFPDDELSYILQSNFTVKEFENRKLDAGAQACFKDLVEMYEDYYNVHITGSANIEYVQSEDIDFEMISIIVLFLFILLLVAIVSAPRRRRTVVVPVGRAGGTVVPPRTSTHIPHSSHSYNPPRSNGGFSSSNRGGSHTSSRPSSSRSGGFGSSSRGGSFSSSSRSSSSFGGSSRSGGFGGGSRGGSFGGGSSRGGGFRK